MRVGDQGQRPTTGPRTVRLACRCSGVDILDVDYPPSTDFDTHRHDEAFLCVAVAGSYVEWSGAGTREVPPGLPVVYTEGSEHAVRTRHGGLRMVHVTDPTGAGWSRPPGPLARGALWQLVVAMDDLGESTPTDDEALHLESLTYELRPEHADDGASSWLDEVRSRLREGYAQPVVLGELARDVGRHPAHVSRAFRTRWGMTLGESLRRVRVAAAVRLLVETAEPLASIALSTGFADQSHMGRWLRRYLGVTPLDVRSGRAPGPRGPMR